MTENSDLLQPPVKTYRRWDAAFICEGLYVGSLRATECVEALRDHNISAVLTVAGRLPVNLPEGIRHFAIDIPDFLGADLLGALHTAIPFIDSELATDGSAQRAILVHCAMGISRSVSVCCAWLMLRKSMTFQDALKLVRVNRPKALPNVGFHAQLTLLSISLQSNASDAAVEVARREYQSDDNTLLKILLTQGLQALINTIDALEERIKQEMNHPSTTPEQMDSWRAELRTVLSALRAMEADPTTATATGTLAGSAMICRAAQSNVEQLLRFLG